MLVAPVMAGKGQNKVYFKFTLIGLPTGENERSWEAGPNVHVRGGGFDSLGESTVTIDTTTYDVLDYVASMHVEQHPEKGFFTIVVDEIVTVDGGTFVIQALGTNPEGKGACFVGFGTPS